MTGWIVAVTLIAYVVEILVPLDVTGQSAVVNGMGYAPLYSLQNPVYGFEPWRMLTTLLVHDRASIPYGLLALTHVGFNMYMLYAFGRPLESLIGGKKVLTIYVLSGLGGSVAVLYASIVHVLDPGTLVIGASGAVFGIFGATIVIHRRLGGDVRYLYVLVAINFALSFVLPNVAWEAHVGGLLFGALVGWIIARNRGPRRVTPLVLLSAGLAVVLVALAVAPELAGVSV